MVNFFRKQKPHLQGQPTSEASYAVDPPQAFLEKDDEDIELLSHVGAREHAALTGIFLERDELISRDILYGGPIDTQRSVWIDFGVMWIALMERLGGKETEAEDAIRLAYWTFARKIHAVPDGIGTDVIDLEPSRLILNLWKNQNNNSWFVDVTGAAERFLFQKNENFDHKKAAIVVTSDIWHIYAATMSALGNPLSRRWFSDDDPAFSYLNPRIEI